MSELRRYTLHLDFVAADEQQARRLAEAYAQGLTDLRPEVDGYTARLSAGDDWSRPTAVFCGAPGPDATDVCTDSAGHPGRHHGPGASHHWVRTLVN
jgi:hypothetical protein